METEEFRNKFKKQHFTTSSFLSGILLMFVDAFIIWCCFGLSFFIINAIDKQLISFRSFVNYWIYLPAFLAVFFAIKLYPGIMMPPGDEVRRFAISCFFCLTGIALSIAVETDDRTAICWALIITIPFATIFLAVGREIARRVLSKTKFWGIPVVIYSKDGNFQYIVDQLLIRKDFGYIPFLIIDVGNETRTEYKGISILKNNEEINDLIKELKLKVAIIVDSDIILNDYENLLPILKLYRYTIKIPKKQIADSLAVSVRDFGGIFGFASTHHLTRIGNLYVKRFFDIFVILIFSPIYLPVMLIIAILVKITSPGPVFFGHVRVGKNGKKFKAWKFRSMVSNAQEILPKLLEENPEMKKEWEDSQKLTNDPRITKLGKFLRKTSLDELPQLLNIFLGQMSLVGPRPVTEDEIKKYGIFAEYVFSVTPGLSGMWQVSGRSETNYNDRIALDIYYLQNWSIWLDIWILLKTVWVVLSKKGAY